MGWGQACATFSSALPLANPKEKPAGWRGTGCALCGDRPPAVPSGEDRGQRRAGRKSDEDNGHICCHL